MDQNMTDKGYPHPLFSLDLLIDGSQSKDQQRFYIPVAEGRLVTRAQLRVRGCNLTTGACNEAVARGLAVVECWIDRFAVYKMGPQWRDNMLFWQGYMNDQEGWRMTGGTQQQLDTQGRQALMAQARDLWRLVALSAGLSGQSGAVCKGPAPEAILPFIDALTGLCGRVRDNAALLADNGFGADRQEALFAVTAGLSQQHTAVQQRTWMQQTCSDRLGVVRGALIGDLGRLSRVATRVLPRSAAAGAQMGRLLGQPRRRQAAASQSGHLPAAPHGQAPPEERNEAPHDAMLGAQAAGG